MITTYHAMSRELATYHDIITPYAQPMLYFFPMHSFVCFSFGLTSSLIQPLWVQSWPIRCSTKPTVLHEANPLVRCWCQCTRTHQKVQLKPLVILPDTHMFFIYHSLIVSCLYHHSFDLWELRQCWHILLMPLFLLFLPNAEQVSLLSSYPWVIVTATLVYIVGSDVSVAPQSLYLRKSSPLFSHSILSRTSETFSFERIIGISIRSPPL